MEYFVSLAATLDVGVWRDDGTTRHHLRRCLKRQRAEQEFEDIIGEWRLLGLVFDRLMFWTFLTGHVISTVAILIIRPLTKPAA